MNKMVKVFVLIPNDCEFSVQYFDDKESAEQWAKTYESGADIIEDVVPEKVVREKRMRTARKGYRI